ncbi:MAG TPA: hypothetical protein VL284_05635, partial [Thermoanaerobaculia bacterium]|nr:hypothetical protein [Thermoanaerobaculia bacterium]
RAERLRPDSWIPTYNRACLYAVTGRPNDALQTLIGLAAGHPLSLELVERDSDLTSVRALQAYAGLRKHLTKSEVAEDTTSGR